MNSIQQQVDRINAEIQKNRQFLSDPELAPLAREELEKLEAQKQALEVAVAAQNNNSKDRPVSSPQNADAANAILEIRGAAGGDEAKIWAADLKRMYTRFAQNCGFKTQELDESTLKIDGSGAFASFKFESGVHRVQRIPATEKQGRIHTSTATVAVLPEIPESQIRISPDDLEWQFTRAGGPGGQYVNKAATAVRLTHKPTGLVVSVRQERLQQQNKSIALQILRSRLWELEEEKREKQIREKRRKAVGRGMRAEKIRTYNYPQNRVTDHRSNKSWYQLESILDGNLEKVIETVSKSSV